MTWPDSFYVDYDHLVTGEVTKIRENGATTGAGVLGTYAYDDRGRRTSLSRGNTTSTSYGYDNVSRLTQIVQNLNGSGSDLTLDFTLNPAGEIASTTRSNDAYAYTGHANANVATSVNGLNQVTAIGGSSVGHDSNGNASSVPAAGSLTGAARSFGYNSENVLATVSGTGAYQEMVGDSLERLFRYYDGSANRWFLYDGQQLIVETNSSGTAVARRYVPGPGIDEPLVWYEGSGTSDRRWFHADERGSVVAVSDGSGDVVTAVNRYDEYGTPQSTLTGRFGYTGQAWLPETGLYHYRMRAYNPAMGRFMQTDPIGFGGGMNVYAYVGNNPVNFVDPMGLDGCEGSGSDVIVCGNPFEACDDGVLFDNDPRFMCLAFHGTAMPFYGGMGSGGAGGDLVESSPHCGSANQARGPVVAVRPQSLGSRIGEIVVRAFPWLALGGLILSLRSDTPHEPDVPIFRAVGPTELGQIRATNQFQMSPNGSTVKQFWLSRSDAEWFADASRAFSSPSVAIAEARIEHGTWAAGDHTPVDRRAAVSFTAAQLRAVNIDVARSGGIHITMCGG